jgi:hypothetical protein
MPAALRCNKQAAFCPGSCHIASPRRLTSGEFLVPLPPMSCTSSPKFSVDFSRTPGVNPDEYEPAIVKLTPAQNTCRIVGATQGKEDARSSPAADGQIYSHYLEEKVAVHANRVATGKYEIAAGSELAPGEYALVFRPISKSKNFSGGRSPRPGRWNAVRLRLDIPDLSYSLGILRAIPGTALDQGSSFCGACGSRCGRTQLGRQQ